MVIASVCYFPIPKQHVIMVFLYVFDLWPTQYIILKLDHLVLLRSITFGKYEQPHVCNVKNVQVFCGVDEEHMTLVLEECVVVCVCVCVRVFNPTLHPGVLLMTQLQRASPSATQSVVMWYQPSLSR